MVCVFFPDKHIKENGKFQSIRTLGTKDLINSSRKKATTDRHWHRHRLDTSSKAPRLGRSFLSRFRDNGVEETPISPRLREAVLD